MIDRWSGMALSPVRFWRSYDHQLILLLFGVFLSLAEADGDSQEGSLVSRLLTRLLVGDVGHYVTLDARSRNTNFGDLSCDFYPHDGTTSLNQNRVPVTHGILWFHLTCICELTYPFWHSTNQSLSQFKTGRRMSRQRVIGMPGS